MTQPLASYDDEREKMVRKMRDEIARHTEEMIRLVGERAVETQKLLEERSEALLRRIRNDLGA